MKHNILIPVVCTSLLSACSYSPIVDTAGRSGAYDEDRAREITNDIQHCQKLADENTNRTIDAITQVTNLYASVGTLGMIPRKESTYKTRVRKCLEGRGHSVID